MMAPLVWDFIIENASETGRFFYANITIYNFRVSSAVNDESVFEYSWDDGQSWNTLETWTLATYPTSNTNRTYAIPNVNSWDAVNQTMFRVRGTTVTGGAETWTWYVDAVEVRISYDDTAPTYNYDEDNSSGAVEEGDTVEVSIEWYDVSSDLNYSILRTNETGSWDNRSDFEFTAKPQYSNFTIDTTGQFGETICWVIWANDSAGNLNDSMPQHCFQVADLTAPQWRFLGTNSSGTVYNNESVNLSAQGYDSVGLWEAWLGTNESGQWVNHTVYGSPVTLDNVTTWTYTNFSWLNNSFIGELWFEIWYRDNTSNWNVTDRYSVTVLDSYWPFVNLSSPGSDTWNDSNTIEFGYYVSSNDDMAGCYLYTNETGWGIREYNASVIVNDSVNFITETFSSDGEFVWAVQCNDTSGNYNISENWTVSIDTTYPAMVIYYPENTTYGSTSRWWK